MAKKRKTKKGTPRGAQSKPAQKAAKKKGPVKKKAAQASVARKTPAKKSPAKKSPAKRSAAKKTPVKKKRKAPAKTKRVSRKKKKGSLGRPRVTGEEKLYLLFKEDFHARQIFAFLRVETVRELEEYSAAEIVKLLSKPIRQTVEGIRRKLAEKNRYLLDDEEYALLHKAKRT